jgi:hypothetical protein
MNGIDLTKLPFWTTLPDWSKVMASIVVVLGTAAFFLRAQIESLLKRYLDRRVERVNIVRSLCTQMQFLQKHMIVAYYYPQVDIGGYDGIISQLQSTVLNDGSMSTLKHVEYTAVTQVLHECDDARRYLSTQARRRRGYSTQYKHEIVSSALRGLTLIYKARDGFRDKSEVNWPASPRDRSGKPYWTYRGPIQRPQECQPLTLRQKIRKWIS